MLSSAPGFYPASTMAMNKSALIKKIVAALTKVNNRLLKGFEAQEVDQLKEFLKRMIANA